nr:phage tail fiber protein [Methylobacterium sp. ZNC0032]
MALSFEQFSGDGINRQFPIDFGYLSRDHISVTVDGVAVAFTFLNNGLVQTAVAPAVGTVVEVRRSTPRETPLTDFVDGSTLTEADLDTATLQTFYLAQEAYDIAGGTLGIQPDGSYSANNRRIGTVADPTGPQDVVNKRYFEGTFLPQQTSLLNQTTAQKEAAVAARTGSETALAAALVARDLALQYRDAAQGHRNAAETAKNDAYSYRTQAYDYYTYAYAAQQAAEAFKNAADASRATAATHDNNAYLHKEAAKAWAEKTDGPVETGKYSAKAWANDAQQYRNTTLTYRNDAETFKNQAAASAAAAATWDPSSYIPKSGGIYLGPLGTMATGANWSWLSTDAGPDGNAIVAFKTSGVDRWQIARNGPDANLFIHRYNAAGTYLDSPFYMAATSGQMVLAVRPTWGATPWDSTNLVSPWHAGNLKPAAKNLLINGCFRINQRGATGGVFAGGYGWDRWYCSNGTNMTVSASQVVTLNGTMIQHIEEPGIAGQVVTVSVEDPSANITVHVGTYDSATMVSGVITAGSGRRGVTLTVPTQATTHVQCKVVTTAATTFKKVQFEMGSVANTFEWRFRGTEAALCQRYYAAGASYHIFGAVNATFGDTYRTQFPVSMRTVPTVGYSYYSTSSLQSYAIYLTATDHFDLFNIASTSTNITAAFTWTANAEL